MNDFIKDADCTKDTPVKLGVRDAPMRYADRYYKEHIKKKGGRKHERVRKSTQYKAA